MAPHRGHISNSVPGAAAGRPCRVRTVEELGDAALRLNGLGAELHEPGGEEIAIEGERLADPKPAHQHEASGIYVRVLPLIMLTEPHERHLLLVRRNVGDGDTWRRGQSIEKLDGCTVTRLTPQERPRLPTDMMTGDQGASSPALEQLDRVGVVQVSPVPIGDQNEVSTKITDRRRRLSSHRAHSYLLQPLLTGDPAPAAGDRR